MVHAAHNNNQTPDREEFLETLEGLKQRFDSMEPEVVETVRDDALDIEGYVVVWNTGISAGGPLALSGKGGTRITPDVTLDEIKMLARTMALKNAAAGLPLGGSKSGFRADPKADGFEEKYRRFVSLCAPFLRENGGKFGGFGFDIGASPEHALWACDELDSLNCFTGKPLDMGGTDYDREGIAGLGVAVAGKTLIECSGKNVQDQSFAVQGLGAMGAAVFRYFSEYGGTLGALGDPKYGGTWSFNNGVSDDLRGALITQDVGTARRLIEAEGMHMGDSAEHVLYAPVDVLFPCAVQHVITPNNVNKVQARYIVEGANQPITKDSYAPLHARGIPVVPDFIANPGGIIAAFVELSADVPPAENVRTKAKVTQAKSLTIEKITQNVKDMIDLARTYDIEPVHAGMYIALRRIFGEE